MRNSCLQLIKTHLSQPSWCYWVALFLSVLEAASLLLGYQSEVQFGLVLPYRLLIFTALVRSLDGVANQNYCGASWLTVPYVIAAMFQYGMNFGGSHVNHVIPYATAFVSLPLFDILHNRLRSAFTLAGLVEIITIIFLVFVAFAHILFHDVLVLFWQSLIQDYLQVVIRMTQSPLSAADVTAIARAASYSMTGRLVISHVLSPILIAYLAIGGNAYLRGERTPVFDAWLSASMSWSIFWLSVVILLSAYSTLLMQQHLGILMPRLLTQQLSGCYDLIRFVPCIFGLSYCHYRIFQYSHPSKVAFYISLFLFAVLGGMLYPILAFVGLIDRAIGLRAQPVNQKPSLPRSTT